MELKILAISAPHWISSGYNRESEPYSFDSEMPFSLHNAFREAVHKAITGESEAWMNSNLVDFETRNEVVVLMNYWLDEKEEFKRLYDRTKPDILFIGAMTLSMPGAIEIAEYAKSKSGSNIFTVLGGKHPSETFFISKNKNVQHHIASPLKLMSEKTINPIFDLVVSGDGENVISNIGEIIYKLKLRNKPFDNFFDSSSIDLFQTSRGDWIAGRIFGKEIEVFRNANNDNIDYATLPIALGQFKFGKGFKILKTDHTVHAYSDTSRGCGYDCFFCSERASINGKLRIKDSTSVHRLLLQFKKALEIQGEMNRKKTLSLFVEDSIFLAGKPNFIKDFVFGCNLSSMKIPFGVQFTLDTFLSLDIKVLIDLKKVGLRYVAFGIETENELIAETFSKNTDKKQSWLSKTENTVEICSEIGISCGMFLIWGLGETQDSRVSQLKRIKAWSLKYNIAIDVGLNIATQHPLRVIGEMPANYQKYTYIDWGISQEDSRLPLFIELFGEASVKYAMNSEQIPSRRELSQLRDLLKEVKQHSYSLI